MSVAKPSIGKENELASFYTTTEVSDGQGGRTITYSEIAYNPVWVSVQTKHGTSRNEVNGSIEMYSYKTIRFRVNELWTPTKNMIVEIRGKKHSILTIDDDDLQDNYTSMNISEVDHG